MTATARLTRDDRARLERERELAELTRLMREPGGLAEAPEPAPLHRAGRDTTERTSSS
ncbi:MAG TPA: hypothetical protein VKG80_23710 [Trebonia sp.]|nr:hypothetical protein [Trebonia sp.]